MSLFVFDSETIARQLLPPVLRGEKMMAWLRVLLTPVQWVVNRFLDDFSDGNNYTEWITSHSYNVGDFVTWYTKENFVCIQAHISASDKWPSGKTSSTLYWLKVQDNFIGLNERATYNAQIIKLEQQLNHWFRTVPTARAYITNTPQNNEFLMGNEMGDYVVNSSEFSSAYMCTDHSVQKYDFKVYVPVTAFPSMVSGIDDQKKAVKQFVDQYRVPGTIYDVCIYTPT